MSEKRQLVERLFEAVEARDAAAVVACYGDDVEIHEAQSLPYGGVYRGRDGGRRHWEAVTSAWRPFKHGLTRGLDPTFIEGDSDTVAVRFRARGIDAAGRRFDAPEVGLYTVRDEAIVRSQMFHADTAAVTAFLRRAGASKAADRSDRRGEHGAVER
jgi:uncharacterized protein